MLIDDLVTTYQKNQSFPTPYIHNVLKETMQYYLLQYISESTLVDKLIFKGSACLRIFFDLPHLSENLNFDLLDPSILDMDSLALSIKNHFKSSLKFDYLETRIDDNYSTLNIEFPILDLIGLPLTPNESKILNIRLEITPSIGSTFTTEPAIKSTRDFSFVIKRYSLPDLMAGTISNILIRVRGWDYFDLVWFLEKGVNPNWHYLDELTGLTGKKAVDALKTNIAKVSDRQLQTELSPYFSSPAFIRSFSQNLLNFYNQYLPILLSNYKNNSSFKAVTMYK